MEKRLDDSDLYIVSLQEKIKNLVTDKDSLNGRVRGLEEEKELYRVNNYAMHILKFLENYSQQLHHIKSILL